MSLKKYFPVVLGPLLCFLIILLFDLIPGNRAATYTAGITIWMATWWMTECVTVAVTAFVPLILFPLFGVADIKTIGQQYGDSIIFLFIGGFLIAFAIEKWGLHKRIAYKILSIVGSKPDSILFGIMLSAFLISNWISNTATCIMLFSSVTALIAHADSWDHLSEKGKNKLAAALLLGLAYAASIGGMATPVGTPTNMIFYKAYAQYYPDGQNLDFLAWAKVGFPIAFLILIATFFAIKFIILKSENHQAVEKKYFKQKYKELGAWQREEKIVGIVFLIAAFLWFTRSDIDFGLFKTKGWSNLLSNKKFVDDAFVAIFCALLLFVIPSSKKHQHQFLLTWEDAKGLRYDIILMFGSGFALAYGIEHSGLTDWIANGLRFLKGANVFVLLLGICLVITIISEFASNVASITLMLPVLVALQKEYQISPLLLMIPATLAASLGFMLPVATAANTIVFGSGRISAKEMIRIGLVLDVIGIIIIALFSYLFL
jgi:solute carrier family 13 (sodium-dependent dicarboxylate transporter), member 2/3/5